MAMMAIWIWTNSMVTPQHRQAYAKPDHMTPDPEPTPEPTPEPPKSTPIVQYADPDGNKAYAYTHWQAIEGKPDLNTVVLISPNGTKYQLQVDDKGILTTKVVSE